MTPTDRAVFNPMAGNPLETKGDVELALRDILDPLRGQFSASGARVVIDASGTVFDRAAAELEGFARPLWGIAAATLGGSDMGDWWAVIRSGLTHGTDPGHPDYWGAVGPVDQRMVELAAIGFALRTCPQQLWEPLSQRAQARIRAYLLNAREQPFPDNNWKFFRLMIDLGLEEIGPAPAPELHDAYLAELDGFLTADGWYRDGNTRQMDHYVAFAFHFYGLLYAKLASGRTERKRVFEQRARDFAPQFEHWFADDGAAIPIGRSLTYRFAMAGFWAALAFAGIEVLPWGVIKGYYLRHLRWWARQPITRRDGLLTVGYAYPNPLIAENYNSSNSPYWACKAFLPLALAADHPFWSAEEAPPRADRATPVSLASPGLIIRHEPGQTVALSSGQSNPAIRFGAEKYCKFAYSTRYAFSIESDLRASDRATLDSMLGLIDADDVLRVRETCEEARIGSDLLYSRWKPWSDVTVETWLWWDGLWQMRTHRIDTGRVLRTIDGGSAVSAEQGMRHLEATCGRGIALIGTADCSGIVDIGGADRSARAQRSEPNVNLMFPAAFVPQLLGTAPIGTTILSSAILATTDVAAAVAWQAPPLLRSINELRHLIVSAEVVGAAAIATL